MKELILYNGEKALIDDEDYPKVFGYTWELSNGYVCTKYCGKWLGLHSMIWGHKNRKGLEIDHIDGNKLNNTKSNLRILTSKRNREESLKMRNIKPGEIKYSYCKRSNKWKTYFYENGKQIWLGWSESKPINQQESIL